MPEVGGFNSIGHQSLQVGATAVKLTPPPNKRPTHALIFVQGADIRWRADGVAPVGGVPPTGVGCPALIGDVIDWTAEHVDFWGMIQKIQFVSAGTAWLDIEYLE